jgi:hypothetical protein
VTTVAKKQQCALPGLDDPNWLPIGDSGSAWIAQDLAIRSLRIAYRERGDHNCELVPLDSELPPDEQSNFFYYVWGPDISSLVPWSQEEQWVRHKFVRQEGEVVARPRPRKPGPKPRHDWQLEVARHLIGLLRSGKPLPIPKETVQWCIDTLDHDPKLREMQKLFKRLLD